MTGINRRLGRSRLLLDVAIEQRFRTVRTNSHDILLKEKDMAGILEQLIKGLGSQNLDGMLPAEKRDTATAASGAIMSAIVRGLAEKSKTSEGSGSLWDMLSKHMQQGNLPTTESGQKSGVEVRDLDPKVTDEILSNIFGPNAGQVQGRIGKVITLDEETTKKLMGKLLPSILGGLLGQAGADAKAGPQSLPDIFGKAKKELDEHQSKSGSIFDVILDRDHDGKVDLSDLMDIFGKAASKSPTSAPETEAEPKGTTDF